MNTDPIPKGTDAKRVCMGLFSYNVHHRGQGQIMSPRIKEQASFHIRTTSDHIHVFTRELYRSDPNWHGLAIRSKTSAVSGAKLDRIEIVSCARKAIRTSLGTQPKWIRSHVHGAIELFYCLTFLP